MADASTSKGTSVPPAKSFMTDGPTLHYSHVHVHAFWGVSVLVFIAACYFWNRLLFGGTITINFMDMLNPELIRLGILTVDPISIYEYPWHIIVLGTLMGILAVGPVLSSQLLNFRYSIPFILAIIFVAKLYLFGVFVLISCLAAACRPLRFRSRFIAIALCIAPQLVYWAVWGGYSTPDAVRWGFSFAPWIYAWLAGLFMAAVVLGIGHFTRYKPGLVWLGCGLLLAGAVGVFQTFIGFAELDYQQYIANNNPENAVEFQEHRITETLDRIIEDDTIRSRLMGELYPIEPIMLREKLKEDLQALLPLGHWSEEFNRKMPEEFNFQLKRQKLLFEYDKFMKRWPDSSRMPNAMYFRALLQEYRPDVRNLVSQEVLRFYNDYPFQENMFNWKELLDSFPQSPESLEARWRIAMNLAGQGEFEKASTYSDIAVLEIRKLLEKHSQTAPASKNESIFDAFQSPAQTVMTPFKLRDLLHRLRKLQWLISPENRPADKSALESLRRFVMLNPCEPQYKTRLDALLNDLPADAALRDNVLLAKALTIRDPYERLEALKQLIETFPGWDGTIQAQYEFAMTKIQLWKNPQSPEELKKQLLHDARAILEDFIRTYPDHPNRDQAEELLATLPQQ